MISRSSTAIIFSRKSVSPIQSSNPFQYSRLTRITGNGLILRVWISVIASNNSSRVPKPPGKMTKAIEYFTNITLRTKKYLKFRSLLAKMFGFCSRGSSIFKPTDAPPASVAPLFAASITPGPPPVITEYRDGWRNLGQHFETLNKLRDNAKDAPRVLTRKIVDDILLFNSVSFHVR